MEPLNMTDEDLSVHINSIMDVVKECLKTRRLVPAVLIVYPADGSPVTILPMIPGLSKESVKRMLAASALSEWVDET